MRKTFRRVRSGLASSCLVAAAILGTPLWSEDLAHERGTVLTVVGRAESSDLPLFPLAEGTGLVFRQKIVKDGAVDLRLHFSVEQPGEGWGLFVRDAEGDVVWSTTAEETSAGEFWSNEIPGDRATVEIHSSQPASLLKLRIDKIAIGEPEVKAVSISGPDQRRPIGEQEDWLVELGRSVARLRFVGDDGQVYVCTAFLVTAELLWTNQHCIATQSEMESALVDFDYDEVDAIGRTLRLSELLDTDHNLDYSVVRLSELAGLAPLVLDATRPVHDEQLLIIQHPGGEPKQVSIADCRVDGPLVAGRGGTETDFGHQCDTLGGSSGSPVFHFGTRRVVGLHHLGINPASEQLFNRASHVDLILAALDPTVRAEIEAAQQSLSGDQESP